jgi:hypothetical protein
VLTNELSFYFYAIQNFNNIVDNFGAATTGGRLEFLCVSNCCKSENTNFMSTAFFLIHCYTIILIAQLLSDLKKIS